MEELYKKYFNLQNLNNSWVITKRHNGNTFFKRKNLITCVKNQPTKDCLYYDENFVIDQVSKLNSNRKKCMYGYENASKYFVNNYKISNWGELKILNEPLPIKNVTKHTKLKTLDTCMSELVAKLKADIQQYDRRALEYKNELPKRLKDITEQYERYIKEYEDYSRTFSLDLSSFLNTDINQYTSSFETQGDKIVKVLYAKKEEKPTNNEGPF